MKILHRFILKSYLGPFVMTFFISLFVLLMQFLWKYIDDLVGKGLEWHIIMKLLLFTSAGLVPLALPLAILLSSIMTMGNLAEQYELAAIKSAGISLRKTLTPLIGASIIISLIAFYFSNNVLPIANLKSLSLLYDVRQQKPALDIKEGIFYNGIEGYTIRVGKKGPDGVTLHNIMIYDHTARAGNNKVVTAESGNMSISANKRYLKLVLNDGASYEEVVRDGVREENTPMFRTKFKQQVLMFDLSDFKLSRTKEDLFKDNHQMLNIGQLQAGIDTLKEENSKRIDRFEKQVDKSFALYNPDIIKSTNKSDSIKVNLTRKNFLNNFTKQQKVQLLDVAANIARSNKSYIESSIQEIHFNDKTIRRYQIEWHRKITLSFACLVLFFIGAPLGAIIKKGGLGLPMVVSVCFFVFFHILSITGEKFAKEGVWHPAKGMWMASAIILPIGIFLSYKASTDSAIFDMESYKSFFKKIFKKGNENPTDLQ